MTTNLEIIANAARYEMECFAKKHPFIGGPDLDCCCAIASYFFTIIARRLGHKAIIVEGLAFDEWTVRNFRKDPIYLKISPNHCWVECDGLLYDITATQFQKTLPNVYIINIDSDEYRKTYWPMHRYTKVYQQLRLYWPRCQTPYSYLPELRDRSNQILSQLPWAVLLNI